MCVLQLPMLWSFWWPYKLTYFIFTQPRVFGSLTKDQFGLSPSSTEQDAAQGVWTELAPLAWGVSGEGPRAASGSPRSCQTGRSVRGGAALTADIKA